MKSFSHKLLLLTLGSALFLGCEPKVSPTSVKEVSDFSYELVIDSTANKNAPALQSFIHATDGKGKWLLFAGRTNSSKNNDNGGLHNLNANYTNKSFPPTSYNKDLYVYDVKNDVSKSISFTDLIALVSQKFPSYTSSMLQQNASVFINSNALVKQQGNYLYVVGGYGPKDITNPTKNYITYNQVARIHVPSLIGIILKDDKKVDEGKLFAFGSNASLVSTGGELMVTTSSFGSSFNVTGGHNFTFSSQKYVDAVYPFTMTADTTAHTLSISLSTAITDVIDPTVPIADNLSNFRRRDGPVTPALFKSIASGTIQQGIAIYAGVFKPGNDLQAWNDAIYVHPDWANAKGKLFTNDKKYNQNNYNVYSCPNFVLYDSIADKTHTFLMGGIGDGAYAGSNNLSGFTNTAVRIETEIGTYPLSSANELIKSNSLFTKSTDNSAPFYGAEAIFFANDELTNYSLSGGTKTEVIDMSSFGDGDVFMGYIFGGIESFASNPGSYGKTKSRASNRVWKVTLKKK